MEAAELVNKLVAATSSSSISPKHVSPKQHPPRNLAPLATPRSSSDVSKLLDSPSPRYAQFSRASLEKCSLQPTDAICEDVSPTQKLRADLIAQILSSDPAVSPPKKQPRKSLGVPASMSCLSSAASPSHSPSSPSASPRSRRKTDSILSSHDMLSSSSAIFGTDPDSQRKSSWPVADDTPGDETTPHTSSRKGQGRPKQKAGGPEPSTNSHQEEHVESLHLIGVRASSKLKNCDFSLLSTSPASTSIDPDYSPNQQGRVRPILLNLSAEAANLRIDLRHDSSPSPAASGRNSPISLNPKRTKAHFLPPLEPSVSSLDFEANIHTSRDSLASSCAADGYRDTPTRRNRLSLEIPEGVRLRPDSFSRKPRVQSLTDRYSWQSASSSSSVQSQLHHISSQADFMISDDSVVPDQSFEQLSRSTLERMRSQIFTPNSECEEPTNESNKRLSGGSQLAEVIIMRPSQRPFDLHRSKSRNTTLPTCPIPDASLISQLPVCTDEDAQQRRPFRLGPLPADKQRRISLTDPTCNLQQAAFDTSDNPGSMSQSGQREGSDAVTDDFFASTMEAMNAVFAEVHRDKSLDLGSDTSRSLSNLKPTAAEMDETAINTVAKLNIGPVSSTGDEALTSLAAVTKASAAAQSLLQVKQKARLSSSSAVSLKVKRDDASDNRKSESRATTASRVRPDLLKQAEDAANPSVPLYPQGTYTVITIRDPQPGLERRPSRWSLLKGMARSVVGGKDRSKEQLLSKELSRQKVQYDMQHTLEEEVLMAEYHKRWLDDKMKTVNRLRHGEKRVTRAHSAEEAADSRPLAMLGKLTTIEDHTLAAYKRIFERLDEDGDGFITAEELFASIGAATKGELCDQQLEYMMRILELVHPDKQSPVQTDGQEKDLDLTFSTVNFQVFSLVLSFAKRMVQVDSSVKQKLRSFDLGKVAKFLQDAKQMFYAHYELTAAEAITLEDLSVEFKAGGLSDEREQAILDHLRANNLQGLNFLDYLAYLPLFLDIHGKIIANPFG